MDEKMQGSYEVVQSLHMGSFPRKAYYKNC